MKYDQFGQTYCTADELADMLYCDPKLDLGLFNVDDPELYNASVCTTYADVPRLNKYHILDMSLEEFDHAQQANWHMPDNYKTLDIAQHVLDLCKTQEELQRVGQELLLFQERDMFDLLRFLKYFVDTMRTNNVVWGLGRGSSVASYVLYLIGVHKINSIYYDLPIEEFLR